MTFAILVACTGVAAWATWRLSREGAPFSVLDVPNERSLHVRPTPRTGGLAVALAIAIGWVAVAATTSLARDHAWIALGTAAIAAISFVDDRGGVSVRWRLLVHLAGAVALVAGGVVIDRVPVPGGGELPAAVGVALTILAVVWMTNLYNFMDGMDGFAGGMAVFGFATLGALLWHGGHPADGAFALVIAASALGFLWFNFPPAAIFMGDVGAAPLGFLAAALAVRADRLDAVPLWASLMIFAPFVVDATVTLARRLLAGERVWQAHRTHYYQRLVTLGWGHRRTVLAEYVVMATLCALASAVIGRAVTVQWLALGGTALALVCTMRAVSYLERRRTSRS